MMERHDISQLIQVSRKYGSDARYVLLGGGNTSCKMDGVMYVKASGYQLGSIGSDGFVAMSLKRLALIWEKTYPADRDEREQEVLADMMAARCGGETARPSVEALLHAIIPFRFVVHLHPAMVNGLTCGQIGEVAASRLFPDAIWIPLVNPGYILAKTVRDAQREYGKTHPGSASRIFLQNHGVFVGADTVDGIDRQYESIMDTISRHVTRKPVFTAVKTDPARVSIIQKALERHFGEGKRFPMVSNRELHNRLTDREAFSSIASAYTPDHIVYSGFAPLWIDGSVFDTADPVAGIASSCAAYERENGVSAKIIAVQRTAAFAVSDSALELFLDTLKVAAFTESFGGPRFMDDSQIEFIRNWEVERYRAKMNG